MWSWMRGMDGYYVKCLVGVSLISVIILLIRYFLGKKLSKGFSYGLWLAIPVFLLLVPFVKIPLPQEMADFGQETWEKLEGEVYTIVLSEDVVIEKDTLAEAIQNGELIVGDGMNQKSELLSPVLTEQQKKDKNLKMNFGKILAAVYGLIVLGIMAGIISTNVRFEHKCRHNRVYLTETPKSKLPVYCLKDITSPFLLCATMYVPDGMTEDELRYAMLHEEGHFKHGDFFWVITRYLVLAIFFYNPIVWLAFKYSGYDCELACDESVMKRIQKTEHTAYGSCLLDVIKKHRGIGQQVLLSTNMKAPKKLIRARIENIVSGHKNSVLVACLATLLVLAVSGCGFMEQKADMNQSEGTGEVNISETDKSSEEIMEDLQESSSSNVEKTENSQDKQSEGEGSKLYIRDDVVDYGDTVYFRAELWRKNGEYTYEGILDKHELCAKIDKDVISFEQNSSMTMEMISYVAKEAVGKNRGDTIQLIREIDGQEYYYYYLITAINDRVGLAYDLPEDWDYQFPQPMAGQFYDSGKGGPDFGFDGRELETGSFFVPYMNEYYTTATATSHLEPIGTNGYLPMNATDTSRMGAWAEGADGYGIGEAIELHQMYMGPGADVLTFTRFCIVNGYAKNEDIWQKNARVKELKVYYGDVYMGSIHLKDCIEPQYIDVSALNMRVCNGREAVFRFEIADVYPGTKYEDTCITGILMEFDR